MKHPTNNYSPFRELTHRKNTQKHTPKLEKNERDETIQEQREPLFQSNGQSTHEDTENKVEEKEKRESATLEQEEGGKEKRD